MNDVLGTVQKAFHAAFGTDPELVTMNTGPDDIEAWDSMGHVALVASLESSFGVSFDVDDLMEMENVHEIVRVVKSKM